MNGKNRLFVCFPDGREIAGPYEDGSHYFVNGYCWVAQKNFIGKLEYFFVDRNGKEIGRDHGFSAKPEPFIGGVSIVRVPRLFGIDQRFGIIDTKGKVLGDGFVWGAIYGFNSGISKVRSPVNLKSGAHYGYINKIGKLLGNGVIYTNASNFYKGRAFVQINWGKYDLIDTNFQIISSGFDDYGGIDSNYFNGKFPTASKMNKFGLLRYDGKVLGKGFVYEDITDVDDSGTAQVKLNGKWGFVDIQGNALGSGLIYDGIERTGLPKGLKVVKKNGKAGLIDKFHKVVGDINLYDNESFFERENKICVKKNGKTGFIDIEGNIVVPLIYDNHDSWFQFGIASVKLNGKFGFVNYEGKIIGKGIVYEAERSDYGIGYFGKYQNQWVKIELE